MAEAVISSTTTNSTDRPTAPRVAAILLRKELACTMTGPLQVIGLQRYTWKHELATALQAHSVAVQITSKIECPGCKAGLENKIGRSEMTL